MNGKEMIVLEYDYFVVFYYVWIQVLYFNSFLYQKLENYGFFVKEFGIVRLFG